MIFPVEGGDQEVLSCGGVSIWVLHAMRDALNKVQKKDRDALAEALKKIYRAETQEEAEEALRSLRERWGMVYPKIVERWETTAYALLAFLRHSRPVHCYLLFPLRPGWVSPTRPQEALVSTQSGLHAPLR